MNQTARIVTALPGAIVAAAILIVASLTPSIAQDSQPGSDSAPIGGRFMLMDHTGKIVNDQDFGDHFLLITFGYTFCPDVCPTNLANMSDTLDLLGAQADKITPIFITVDPKRDTAAMLRRYVANFNERLVGLTGSDEMIEHVKSIYKITGKPYRPEGWTDGEYLVDHTASIFLMSPDGTFLVKFAHGMPPADMAKRIQDFLP